MLTRLLFPRAALWILLTLVGSMSFPDPATSESYIAGQFGVTLASELTDGNLTSHGLSGLQVSDQDLKSSLMGGIKLGHYFTKARWLGIETELFYTTPHIKQGTLTFSGPGGSVSGEFLGLHHRMLTWAPVNIVIRYPYYRLQPYAAIGPGLFFGRIKDSQSGLSQSGTTIGLNTQVGLKYFVTRKWVIFTEWKYNLARMGYTSQDDNPDAPIGFRATYSVHMVAFGIGYHF